MNKLPKRFPEFSIMYKTLTKKIHELETKSNFDKDIQKEIERYESEREKIRKMFPEGFFENRDKR